MNNKATLPAEWQPQDAIMLTWPHNKTDWASILPDVESVYIDLVTAITAQQKVVIICHDQTLVHHVQTLLAQANINLSSIYFVVSPTNDTWTRDHGPITTRDKNSQVTALNYQFNGWGQKHNSEFDNQINDALFTQCKVQNHKSLDFILEGGAIDVDEDGHLLTTAQCLLNPNRNSGLDQTQIETQLKTDLGINKVLWLTEGLLEGDDTDSHIDTLARFAPNQIIIYQGCQDESDSHFESLNKMKQELELFTTVKKEPFILFELPLPEAQYNSDGERLPASYANFLIINKKVLVPVYSAPQDKKAMVVIQMAFPEHEIVPINCRSIIEQFGSLHCLTMQLPKGFLSQV